MPTTISIPSTGVTIASILNPGFKGIPDAGAVAKYLLNAMITIKRYDLPIRIYLTKDVAEKIGNILSAMGIRFKLLSIDKMTPPYIYIYAKDQYFVVKTVDENGNEVAEFSVLSTKFIENLQAFIIKKKRGSKQKKNGEEVEELIIHPDFLTYIKKIEEESLHSSEEEESNQ
ncbi:MAG: hypothetical protein QXV28_06995 [Ignisphaera sp.]